MSVLVSLARSRQGPLPRSTPCTASVSPTHSPADGNGSDITAVLAVNTSLEYCEKNLVASATPATGSVVSPR